MIFTSDFLTKLLHNRNLNVLVYGSNTVIFDTLKLEKKTSYNIDYKQTDDIYCINNQPSNKSSIIELIQSISSSPNYYSKTIQKKVVILLNLQNLNKAKMNKIKTISEVSFKSTCYILHTQSINQLDMNIRSRFLVMSLPVIPLYDDTITITYEHIIELVKQPFHKNSIEIIRELCYMYYMNHLSSLTLQQMIVRNIGSILTLPNQIKYNIVRDIVDINRMYAYSYRKPIFLECIIYSLFKHLEHYKTNL